MREWLLGLNFTAMMTLSLINDKTDPVDGLLLTWVRKIQLKEKLQLAYWGITSTHGYTVRRHVHLLMRIKGENYNPDSFTLNWYGEARFTPIPPEDRQRAVEYLVTRNMTLGYESITPYNMKLLLRKTKQGFAAG